MAQIFAQNSDFKGLFTHYIIVNIFSSSGNQFQWEFYFKIYYILSDSFQFVN